MKEQTKRKAWDPGKKDSTKVKQIPRMSQDDSFKAGLNREQIRIKRADSYRRDDYRNKWNC